MSTCISISPRLSRWLLAGIVYLVLGLQFGLSHAADEVVHFDNPDHKALYEDLLKQYRCLKCQNQNLWDSNASLAGDLRREIRQQILAGNDQSMIDTYLVDRYGEFVLYKPRFNSTTAVLWIGPFVLLIIALVSAIFMIRSRSTKLATAHVVVETEVHAELKDAGKLAKARELLKD